MKKSTQKILLALYTDTGEVKRRVHLSNLQLLVPELSDGGFRSLLFVLRQQGIIVTQKMLGVSSVSITHHGTVQLEAEFPALSHQWDSWQGKWEILVFLDSPKFDNQFRYLRNLLISEGALLISRGVYLCPGGFSQTIQNEYEDRYRSHVLVFSVDTWKSVAESIFVTEKYGLLDVAESYSGISREVDRLINTCVSKKGLINRSKIDINLVYDRIRVILLEDPGFCTFYYSEVPHIKKSLLRLNSLISI